MRGIRASELPSCPSWYLLCGGITNSRIGLPGIMGPAGGAAAALVPCAGAGRLGAIEGMGAGAAQIVEAYLLLNLNKIL